ncbi:hypothetical protein DH86_00000499 [Scytalidium sp. 3C]|nr:hypothetical protein DH86_00000499 [Scytalidium sp. 3C]
MAAEKAVLSTNLTEYLPLLARGKVREVYTIDDKRLLFVATDRISAYDYIMKNGIPTKGSLLTQLSARWFDFLQSAIPSLRIHFLSLSLPTELKERLPADVLAQLENRSMVVRKLKVFPIEAIVRGYITGSGWKEYTTKGTVHGMHVEGPGGRKLVESEKLEKPIYTPSARIVGEKYAKQIENLSLEIYTKARDYALSKGIIIADTKFEFGLDEETDEVVLVDEVLTPDSSRFWPAATYQEGKGQDSFDKQFLRGKLSESSH